MKIPFIDLPAQNEAIKSELYPAVKNILARGDFILGKEMKLFENEFAKYCGTKYCVGVSSGTAALFLALKSLDIKEGDEVIVPAFTFIATAFAVTYTGATPVFVDIDQDSYCMDYRKLEKAITKRTKAIIPVHLFGHPAEMQQIIKIAKKYNLKVIEDAAQAHGATYNLKGLKKKVGSLGDIGCFSFYPTKNLSACGDAGAITTNNKKIYDKLLILRDCGRVSRYEHKIIGYNSRLDTLQAAILRVKLKRLDIWNRMRRQKAKLYNGLLSGFEGIILSTEKKNVKHAYHLYVIRAKNREWICQILKKHNIPFLFHYPIPLHLQKAYKSLGYKKGDFPVSERVTDEIISLPMHPFLRRSQIEYITKKILSSYYV